MTSSLHTLIGPGQDTISFRQASRPRNQRETEWQKCVGGAHRSLSVRQKLRNLRNCSRRSRKEHNSKEACSSLTLLADARVTKKKVYRVTSWIKDRRCNILQHLENNPRRRSNRTSRCFHTKRPSQAMKHRGSRNFRPHRAEACRNQRPIPHTCGDKQLLRCQLG